MSAKTVISVTLDGNNASYAVKLRLGEGAFGKADLCDLQREVVLKRVPMDRTAFANNPKALQLAEAEGKVLATLSHPNIVRIYHAWTDVERREIIMELEFCGGGTLRKALNQAIQANIRIDAATLKSWLAQLALGIVYIHDMGILHRDLKTENVMLSTDKKVVKIADFGTAKLLNTNISTIGGIGTITYMAPEIFLEEEDETLRSKPKVDVWAFGVIAYELAAQELPYEPQSAATAAIDLMKQFMKKRVPPKLAEIEKQYSAQLRRLIEERLLVLDHGKRWEMSQVVGEDYLAKEVEQLQKRPEYSNHIQRQIRKLQDERTSQSTAVLKDAGAHLQHQSELQSLRKKLEEERSKRQTADTLLKDAFAEASVERERLNGRIRELEQQLRSEKNRQQQAEQLANLNRQQPQQRKYIKPAVVNQAKQQELFEAAAKGETSTVTSLLMSGQVDLEGKDRSGKVNERITRFGVTPLMLAAEYGHVDTCRVLVNDFSANIEAKDCGQWNALMYAALNGHAAIVKMLVEKGAKLNEKNNRGETAFSLAGNQQIKDMLIQFGVEA